MSSYHLRLLFGTAEGRLEDEYILPATLEHLETLDKTAESLGLVPLSAFTDETDLVWELEEAEYAEPGETWDNDSAQWFYPKEALLTLAALIAQPQKLEELDEALNAELQYMQQRLLEMNLEETVFHLMVEEDQDDDEDSH
ncbi:hypothetical protein ACKC9G_15435 [Pokkaliibacter sp. CJK22405]|uniref:hypothetical protein n=1 Tax=Pokkaliibacter sp. CJK22405 TaxID=3384615 RepID=UPI003984C11B